MNETRIIEILTNSGFEKVQVSGGSVIFQDPSCIFPAFDAVLDYAWIVCLTLTAIIIFGWGILYIRNGSVNTSNLFKNSKSLFLILMVLSVVKPAVDFIYQKDLFSSQCDMKSVELSKIEELLEQRDKQFSNSEMLFPGFDLNDLPNLPGSPDVGQNDDLNDDEEVPVSVTFFRNRAGELMQHTGGSRSWRNNNPGNIRATAGLLYGANGVRDGFLVFPDVQTGLNAISRLFRGDNYNSLTLAQAMQRYAPSADHNNPHRYAQHISKATGIPVSKKIKDLSDADLRRVALSIRTFEGWDVGTERKL